MIEVTDIGSGYEMRYGHEVIRVQPWGTSSLRVRIAQHRIDETDHGALEPAPPGGPMSMTRDATTVVLRHDDLEVRAVLDQGAGNPRVLLSFLHEGRVVLGEKPEHFWWPGAHGLLPMNGATEIHQVFASDPDERLFGLGQYSHGRLDQKNLVIDLVQRNGEVTIPFVLSSKGYGFLWNNPAIGRVELAADHTRWVGYGTEQVDYWLTVGDAPASILSHYADAVGHAPVLPDWATGFWQSKLRYQSQDELLAVARRYRDEGVPLSVIVSDFIHWPAMGDFRFDEEEFPDVKGMVEELTEMGVRLMVSIWPTVSPLSENVGEMRAKGYLVATSSGVEFHQCFKDKGMPVAMPVAFYDATNPGARQYVWDKVRRNYYDLGIRVFWLDACEPELNPGHPNNLSYFAGPGLAVSNTYPRDNARGFHEGMTLQGEDDVVLLCRSAWAGQAKYGAAVWSGDIAPTWQALREQVTAGQNIGIAGIPWWTSDIGGFHGGDPADPGYQELFVRWFQFGALCPLFRLHGHREPRETIGAVSSGGPNEIWSYGDEAFRIAKDYIRLRERLRPYIGDVMREASETGTPAMRALFIDHPDDEKAWQTPDEFLLGHDLLVCPVTEPGARTWSVYLPAGSRWELAGTGQLLEGGHEYTVPAPLERMPLFVREGAAIDLRP